MKKLVLWAVCYIISMIAMIAQKILKAVGGALAHLIGNPVSGSFYDEAILVVFGVACFWVLPAFVGLDYAWKVLCFCLLLAGLGVVASQTTGRFGRALVSVTVFLMVFGPSVLHDLGLKNVPELLANLLPYPTLFWIVFVSRWEFARDHKIILERAQDWVNGLSKNPKDWFFKQVTDGKEAPDVDQLVEATNA